MATPSPIPVTVTAAPAQWWQIVAALGPFAILIAAVVAAAVGLMTLRQSRKADTTSLAEKTGSDSRSEWWSRAQWALDASLSADPKRQTMGLRIMAILARSELAGKEEAQIIQVAWHQAAPAAPRAKAPLPAAPDDPMDRQVRIAAARLRLITDSKLGKVTPEWVKKLADDQPEED